MTVPVLPLAIRGKAPLLEEASRLAPQIAKMGIKSYSYSVLTDNRVLRAANMPYYADQIPDDDLGAGAGAMGKSLQSIINEQGTMPKPRNRLGLRQVKEEAGAEDSLSMTASGSVKQPDDAGDMHVGTSVGGVRAELEIEESKMIGKRQKTEGGDGEDKSQAQSDTQSRLARSPARSVDDDEVKIFNPPRSDERIIETLQERVVDTHHGRNVFMDQFFSPAYFEDWVAHGPRSYPKVSDIADRQAFIAIEHLRMSQVLRGEMSRLRLRSTALGFELEKQDAELAKLKGVEAKRARLREAEQEMLRAKAGLEGYLSAERDAASALRSRVAELEALLMERDGQLTFSETQRARLIRTTFSLVFSKIIQSDESAATFTTALKTLRLSQMRSTRILPSTLPL